ncbi:MAG: NAD(P)H-dependent oxidoreductase subunit E [Vulcanococcus sp.]|jgi:NADH:ubiquinone oxidoreductase subunit E|uniref:NAD(P)H-dependent oxidoreductase subunit E n=1 Tax=Vulcanococcus sp. TaxID=2856995 RepID=UPI003C0BA0CA
MAQGFEQLEPVLEQHGYRADALLEVLAAAQRLYGYLSAPLLRHLADALHLPLSRVQGTASFYHLFRFQPPARHQCLVCTGTACHVQGAPALLAELRQNLPRADLEIGEVRCIGTCSGAPLVVVDGEVWNQQQASGLRLALEERLP